MAKSYHLLSVDDLGHSGILGVLDRAEELRLQPPQDMPFLGKVLGLLIFQPSTRTRVGFHAAMVRLGGAAIEVTETKLQQGMGRAESLADTVRSISSYCDGLVLRHSLLDEFRAAIAVSDIPVINGGSGWEQHPTQALIDLYAIRRHFARLEGLRIGIVGDLEGSRAARSLIQALGYFTPRELRLMSPEGRGFPLALLGGFGGTIIEVLQELTVEGLDVLYMAGLPEGLGEARLEETVRERFRLTRRRAERLPPEALVLNPLPRIDEIEPEVDELSIAGYFQQSKEGLFVRCSVLERVLGTSY